MCRSSSIELRSQHIYSPSRVYIFRSRWRFGRVVLGILQHARARGYSTNWFTWRQPVAVRFSCIWRQTKLRGMSEVAMPLLEICTLFPTNPGYIFFGIDVNSFLAQDNTGRVWFHLLNFNRCPIGCLDTYMEY